MLQSVTTSDNQTITLSTDKRIKHDAIRILRTINPEIGLMYADTRKKGVRYKIAYRNNMNIQDMQALVVKLNNLYMRADLFPKAVAYIHEEQNQFRYHRVCVFIKK